MRIVHLTNNSLDGVGRAVMRVHERLLSIGVNSQVLVLYNDNNDKYVTSLLDNKVNYGIESLVNNKLICLMKKISLKVLRHVLIKPKFLFNYIYPWISCNEVLSSIGKDDVVVLYSTQEMIKSSCLYAISKISSFPVIIRPLDMEPFTGGCHFNYGCTKYKKSCGNCGQLTVPWRYDISYRGLQLKKKVYSDLNCKVITSNKYVKTIAEESAIFNHKSIDVIYMGIEEARYRSVDQRYAREKLNIPLLDKVIIFGCFNFDDPRKGAQILKQSLIKMMLNTDFYKIKDLLHIVTFGRYRNFTFSDLDIRWSHLGTIESSEKMNNIYRSGDILASPSIDDLGPTIVQEAFLNDLPVVAFDLGVACDLIKDSVNGYLIQPFSVNKFSDALMNVLLNKLKISISANERIKKLKQKCTVNYEADEYMRMVAHHL